MTRFFTLFLFLFCFTVFSAEKPVLNSPLAITSVEQVTDSIVKINASMEKSVGNSYQIVIWTEEVSLPSDLMEKGYKLYSREFEKMEGTFWMLEENMEAMGYSCNLVMTLPETLGGKPVRIKMAFYASTAPEMPAVSAPPVLLSPVEGKDYKFWTPDYYPVINFTGEATAWRVIMSDLKGNEVTHRIYYKNGPKNIHYKSVTDGKNYIVSVQQADNSLRWSQSSVCNFRIVFGFKDCSWCYGKGVIRCDKCYGSGNFYDYTSTPAQYTTCKTCNGTGKVKCQWCNGQGWSYK